VVLAVHAAKKWSPELAALCLKPSFRAALESCGVRFAADLPACKAGWNLPLGCVVGLVRLVECGATALMLPGPGRIGLGAKYLERFPEEMAFGDFTPGRYGWVADRFHPPAEPIPLRGFQSVFNWDASPEVEAVARETMEEP
jgi:hypothetical protein